MSSIPNIIRTTTPIPVQAPVPPKTIALRSQVMPGRIINVVRTDGKTDPLMREDLLFVARSHFVANRVQHFCSYASGEAARYDAELMPDRPSYG